MADFSRRIAVALHGAEALVITGVDNDVPTLSELGKGQLPFTSVALGFQLFGLSDWAGRLPLALWAALGLGATYLLVSRLMDRVAAAYSSLALATMPLYFLQARTMLGDAVTLAAVAVAASALGVSTFHPFERRGARWACAVIALLALLAGFAARGALFGVACPALGVGLAWCIWRLSGQPTRGRFCDASGVVSSCIGMLALAAGVWALASASPAAYLEVLGSKLAPPSKLPTHDAVLHQLGFGLFPWSAVAPFALAIALRRPTEATREGALRVCLVCVFLVAIAVHGASAPFVGTVPFVGTFAVAALTGVAFRDMEGSAQHTRLLALATVALLIVFLSDLRGSPEQALRAFSVADAAFPESFTSQAKRWLEYGSVICVGVVLLALGELPKSRGSRLDELKPEYLRWVSRLRALLRGAGLWAAGVLALLLGVVGVLRRIEARGIDIPGFALPGPWGAISTVAALAVPVIVVGPLAFLLLRDCVGAFLSWLPVPRARLALLGITAFGLSLSLGYYPALAAHLSPRDVFESFRERAKPGEALAVLGPAARVAPYYAGGDVHTPPSARAGLDWLLESKDQRRWLVLGSRDLGQLNQLYRERVTPQRNLPILDAISSEVLLASNQLLESELNENPLSMWITTERPEPAHPLDVDLNGQLRCLGWAITDKSGNPITEVKTGEGYDFRIYWEVVAPVAGTWKTFIHIDGNRRRYNGDHDTLQGKYPLRFWQKGDFVTDVHPFELEPHFSGSTYQVYFGLYSGDNRLAVRSGAHHDNRIMGGSLVVR
jgi:4-amino-4-deoxy-L-arabinose transferase-like glycosyltransferase